MAKKAAKGAKKKAAQRGATKKAKRPAPTAARGARKAASRTLRQPPLAGLPARTRNARLDKLAEGIGECRDQINEATTDEKSFRAAALKEMHDKGITNWSHAGVDLIRVPGSDTLKVKTHKAGSSETGGGADDSGGDVVEGEFDTNETGEPLDGDDPDGDALDATDRGDELKDIEP